MKYITKHILIIALLLFACMFLLTACEHTHEFGEWIVEKEATCTENGRNAAYCSCGESKTKPIYAEGHSYGSWKTTKNATCTEEGEKTRYCVACSQKEEDSIAVTGHKWENGICKYCATNCKHSTKQGTCSMCEIFVNELSEELNIIREAKNEIARLVQQTSLIISFGGNLNIENCNAIVEQLDIIKDVFNNTPQDFIDYSANFNLLFGEWSSFVSKVNSTQSATLRISYWKSFTTYYHKWQNTNFSVSSQYYPPK